MQKTIVTVLLSIAAIAAQAQDYQNYQDYDEYEGEGPRRGMFACSAGLNSDGYEVDLNISYWPISTFGLKLAIGTAGEIEEVEDWDWLYDDYYSSYYTDHDYTVRFKFMPSIEMRTPSLLSGENRETTLHLFVNPGLCLSPGASGSRNAQWLNWQLRGGIELDVDCLVLQLGYGYSDFYLYSGRPYSHHGYDDNPNHKTHSGFFTIGLRF